MSWTLSAHLCSQNTQPRSAGGGEGVAPVWTVEYWPAGRGQGFLTHSPPLRVIPLAGVSPILGEGLLGAPTGTRHSVMKDEVSEGKYSVDPFMAFCCCCLLSEFIVWME